MRSGNNAKATPTFFDLLAHQQQLPDVKPLRPASRRPTEHPVILAQHKGEEQPLDEAYRAWIEANPVVLDVFIRRAKELIAQGRQKFGAKRIVEDMRWDERLWTHGEPWKINNRHVSRLVRDAIARCPELAPYFELRELQS